MASTCFGHLHVHLQEFYMLFHCRMWCYAIGVEAVVLRDHSLNTYGIIPHAAVIQHISTPEDGHVNVRNM